MITDTKVRRIITTAYCMVILAFAIWFMISPKKEFSENENRYLAKTPVLSVKNMINGDLTETVNNWFSDHFPMRDLFMGTKSAVEMAVGRKEINGVYIAKEDYLIEAYQKPVNTERISDTLRKFYEKIKPYQVDVRLMLVPTAVTIYEEKLPDYAPIWNQMETAREIYEKSGIPMIDCMGQLEKEKKEGQLYYYTDHHWTTFGAYQGYLTYCEAKGITPSDEFVAQTVTEEFAGTLYSKVNDYRHKKDVITLYTYPADRLKVMYTDTGEVSDSLYNLDYLDKKDKYSLFLNNVHTLIEIENETAKSDAVLMLLKDSYANSIVPFLSHHYRKIYVLDTRYYKDGPSNFLAEHEDVTDVLILYNMGTIDTDTGIRGIY